MAAQFTDLRDFIATLEAEGQLVRISTEVDPNLEMTEIADRTLRGGGPALLFENPKGYSMPVLANLFGTETRVARGMGATSMSFWPIYDNPTHQRECGTLSIRLRC